MDSENYEQVSVSPETLGGGERFLLEGMKVQVAMHDGMPLYVELPVTIEVLVARPTRVCRVTAPPAARSRPRWRPARGDPGPAVHQHRRQAQGRLPRPGNYLGRVNS